MAAKGSEARPFRVLSLGEDQWNRNISRKTWLKIADGGGVRGLSTLYILERLMHSMDPKNPLKPCDVFDDFAGTSTGGLIALMLGRMVST
jgi:patatin-like phospholipase/acyl hydrolase